MKASLLKKSLLFFLGIVVLLSCYELLSLVKNDSLVYPSVFKIFKQVGIILSTSNSYIILLKTLGRVLLIIGISFVISMVLSIIYFRFRSISYLFFPLINILKAAPFAIIAIYLFLAIGNKNAPYVMCFFVIFPIIFEGFLTAIDNISTDISDDLKILDLSIFKKYFKGVFPILLPYIVMSILQSFGLGIKTMIMTEYLCNIGGSIGEIVYNIKYTMDFDILLAWLVVIIIIVTIIDLLIRRISNKFLKNIK